MPTSDWYLDGVDIPAMKIIKSAEKEVWQVVVRKLRVWCHTTTPVFPDTPVDDAACRPWCILVFNLYPAGRILTHQWCNPPDVFPTGAAVMPILLSLMRDPPDSVPQRRPKSIVFADTVLASQCFNSLMALGVECSQLFETPGTSGIVRELSRIMIDKDVATGGGAASSLPGTSLCPLRDCVCVSVCNCLSPGCLVYFVIALMCVCVSACAYVRACVSACAYV